MLCYLRQVIFSCSPFIQEKIAYGTPFYYFGDKRLCYIHVRETHVEFALCYGEYICDPFQLLDMSNSSSVKRLHYYNLAEIDPDKVIAYLQQAILINELRKTVSYCN